jgi:rRNA maturation endonuclease Nob1
MMSVVERIRSIVAERESAQDSDTATPRSTSLYRCATCENTFVTDSEMDVCPQCDGPVTQTPTEQDLGLL